ncbi:hypothetical protein [Kiloniella sp.]|uniref:hypothetical protein n=1 Tax=Kiloniella sp. TaxID=1938587 RepID=UPI003A930278
MSVLLKINSDSIEYTYSRYDTDKGFILTNQTIDPELPDNKDEVYITSPLKLDTDFNEKDFEIHFLTKKDIKENEIFQIYTANDPRDKKRVGWLIPTNSLDSDQHDYSENPHFLKYAYKAIEEAIIHASPDIYMHLATCDSSGRVNLSDIFHKNTVILIISKETLVENQVEFDIDKASPSLIKHGYVKLTSNSPDTIWLTSDPHNLESIFITPISENIQNYQLVSELLNSSFAYEKNSFFQFFFLYQIIELLMDDIFQNQQNALVDKLIEIRSDSGKVKDVLENINKSVKEKKRLSLLIDDYTTTKSELEALKENCNQLLRHLDREPGKEFHEYLYPIRNFIFHQYRDFPEIARTNLDHVVKELIDIIPGLLSTYSYPRV